MILLVASLPILISAGALLFFRQSAARAGVLGLGVAILVAFLVGPFRLAPAAVGGAVLEGSLTTLIVAYVLLGGVLLYHVMRLGGALEALSAATARAIPDPAHRLLTLVFGVSVFFESATGFGIGIVVCAPLFLALGFAPLRAAFLALLGQCAVPWGALAIGTTLGSELSGVESAALGIWGALFSLPFILLCGAVALAVGGLWKPVGQRLLQLLVYTSDRKSTRLNSSHVAISYAVCVTRHLPSFPTRRSSDLALGRTCDRHDPRQRAVGGGERGPGYLGSALQPALHSALRRRCPGGRRPLETCGPAPAAAAGLYL